MEKNIKKNQISRRRFIGYTASAAAFSLTPGLIRAGTFGSPLMKPDSTFGGVPIGAITYSFRSMPGTNAEDTLDYLVKCGLSHCELMSGPIEESAGAPAVNMREIMAQFPPPPPPPPAENDSTPPPRRRFQMSPEMREAMAAAQAKVTEWRINQTNMDKFKKIRQLYNEAGVYIHIVKFDNIGQEEVSDKEHEYMFNVAKAMGAIGITCELDEGKSKRLAAMAEKQGIAIGFHNHTQLEPDTYSAGPYFSDGKKIMSNLDIGHYAAGNGQSALKLVKELGSQGRILSIHIKDRTFDGETVPFGEGDAQVAEILQLVKKEKWGLNCDIELEYRIPEDSDAVKETAKCVDYCKKVLS